MPNKKVLIVDDEPDMRLAIKNVLKIREYDSIEAGDGKTAIELVEKENPDIVLLDIRLPGMDGIETLERIRKINKKIPVVMITGYGHIQSAVDVMKLGAQEYLQKPFENKQLVEIVRRFVESGAASSEEEIPKQLPVKKSKNSWAKKIVIALFITGGLLLFVFKIWMDRINYKKSYSIEFSEISGISIVDNYVFVGDWLNQKIMKYKLENGILALDREYNLGDIHLTAFVLANDRLYLSDSWRQVVELRALDEKLSLIKTYNIGKIMSMSFDGKNIWLIDDQNNVYVRSPNVDFSLLRSYKILPADEIFKDKEYLWAILLKEGKIYRYKCNGNLKEDKIYRLRGIEKEFSAFTMHGDKIYYAVGGEKKLVEVNKENLKAY